MLKIEHLSVAVRGRKILNDINLHIKPGEVHVLFGPNGTGKSTLIGAIMGFNRYEILEGKIYFKGQDITDMSCDERARLGDSAPADDTRAFAAQNGGNLRCNQ